MTDIIEPKTGHVPPEVAERQLKRYSDLLGLGPIPRLGDIEEAHDESFDEWADEIYYGEEQ